MELYLVRHTTPLIEKGICYGQADIPLTETFNTESEELLNKLDFDSNTLVYSSPLSRCIQLAKKINSNIIIDDRLLELNFGTWELQQWNDIPSEELDPWMASFVDTKIPGGESYLDLYKRAVDFLEGLKVQPLNKAIVVTHSGVIRALIAHITKTALKDSFDIKINYGHIVHLTISDRIVLNHI